MGTCAADGFERYFPTPLAAEGRAADSRVVVGAAARFVPNHLYHSRRERSVKARSETQDHEIIDKRE